jgi:hypothetical protein
MNEIKKGLQLHEIRVVTERVELIDKITKLHTFMGSNFYQTLSNVSQDHFKEQEKAMKTYSDVLLKRINHFEGKIEDTIIEPTRGQELVGFRFNPSGLNEVDKAKQLSADLIDMVLYDHDDKSDKGNAVVSWNRNILKTAAINAVIAAQMAVVKILTWTK